MWRTFPRWVWIGSWLLAMVAGQVNAIGLLTFRPITHMTGTTTQIGAALAGWPTADLRPLLWVVASFVLGSAVSGLLAGESTARTASIYTFALIAEAALLAISTILLIHGHVGGYALAAAAVGLQNGMTSTYSGSAVRTSHVSGMVTDLGIMLGHAVRRRPVDRHRVRLCVTVITGFLTGAFAGAAVELRHGPGAMFVPAILTAAIAVGFEVFKRRGIKSSVAV